MLLTALLAIGLAGGCLNDEFGVGSCDYSGSIDNGGVTIGGEHTGPGDTGGGIDIEGGSSEPGRQCTVIVDDRCRQLGPDRGTVISHGPVTLADIASFVPTVGGHSMQPNGWAAVGLPANFVSGASSHVVGGVLLGTPAEVRFTPVSWSWDYGDGATVSSTTGGATWQQLGVGEFEPTATSHVFVSRGRYVVTLSVTFTAEYRIAGGPWVPIAGALVLDAPPLEIVGERARTVLVDEDCIRNPRGPGC